MSRKRATTDGDNSDNGLTDLPSLPAGWSWAKVHEVGEVKLGRQRSPEHHHGPHMRPYLRVANVYEDRIDLSDVLEMNFTPEEFETYKLRHGDILLNEGQSLEWVGRPAMYKDDLPGACFQNTLVRFRPGPHLLPSFALLVFRYYLHSQRFQKIAKWTVNIAHLGASRFAQLEFPLPPKGEQGRIVEKFEELYTKLDAGIFSLKRVKLALKKYRATVLKAAAEGRLTEAWREKNSAAEPASKLLERILGERRFMWEDQHLAKSTVAGKQPSKMWHKKYAEPTGVEVGNLPSLPSTWAWTKLEAVLREPLRNGHSAKASVDGLGVRTLTLTAVTLGDFSEKNTKVTVAQPDDVHDLWLQPGDILIERSNTPELVGTSRLYRGPRDFAIYPDLLIRARICPAIDDRYIEAVLQASFARTYLRSRAKGLAGSMPKIDQGTIMSLPIPLPPADEQCEIAREVERRLSIVEQIEAQVEANLKRAKRLRQCILKRASEGQLVPQDHKDETADRILGRVRAERGMVEPSGNDVPGSVRGGDRRRDEVLPLFDKKGGVDER